MMMRSAISLLLSLLVGAAYCQTPPATPPATAPDAAFFKDSTPLDLTLRPDQTVSASLTVYAKDAPAKDMKFYADLTRISDGSFCKATVASGSNPINLEKGEERKIQIEITGCADARGKLGITGSKGSERDLILDRGESGWLTTAVLLSLGLGIAVALVCGRIVQRHGHKLNDRIGKATWDFATSWASNVTVFGTAFSFLMQLAAFPDKPLFGARTEYVFLAAFAMALVGFAPMVHRLTAAIKVDDSSGAPVMSFEGLVWGFLAACIFTIWGALLQIGLQILLVNELSQTSIINQPVAAAVKSCVAAAGIGLLIYCFRTILRTIQGNASRTGTATAGVTPVTVTSVALADAAKGTIAVL